MNLQIKIEKLKPNDLDAIYNCLIQYEKYLFTQIPLCRNDISITKSLIKSLVRKATGKTHVKSLKTELHETIIICKALKFQIDYGNSNDQLTSISSRLYYLIEPKI